MTDNVLHSYRIFSAGLLKKMSYVLRYAQL